MSGLRWQPATLSYAGTSSLHQVNPFIHRWSSCFCPRSAGMHRVSLPLLQGPGNSPSVLIVFNSFPDNQWCFECVLMFLICTTTMCVEGVSHQYVVTVRIDLILVYIGIILLIRMFCWEKKQWNRSPVTVSENYHEGTYLTWEMSLISYMLHCKVFH